MATILHFADSRGKGCGATVRFESGEPCTVSIARSSVLVKKSRTGIFGPILYREENVYKNARTAMALAYLFPVYKTPMGISNPVLLSFFNAMLHCASCAEFSVLLNEAVRSAEKRAGCPLDEIAKADFPAWATGGDEGLEIPPAHSHDDGMKRQLMSALDRLASEFEDIVNGIPSVKAAAEYMKLDNWIEEPAMSAAFMVVALVVAKKHQSFFGGNLYIEFRTFAAERMSAIAYETVAENMDAKSAKRHGFSFADKECTRCHEAVSRVIRNFIDETPYPMNPVYSLINERIRLAYKRDGAGQIPPGDIEKNFRPIFTKMFDVANSIF